MIYWIYDGSDKEYILGLFPKYQIGNWVVDIETGLKSMSTQDH